MPRKSDPQTQQIQLNIGTLKMGVADIGKFKAALKYYGWESIAMYLRQAALALIRHHAAGESIMQPLRFHVCPPISPRPGQRQKYGHVLASVAADQVDRENNSES
jgi:hypothetical protein